MNRILQALQSTRRRGWRWALERIRIEFSTPTTPLGRSMRPILGALDRNMISPILATYAGPSKVPECGGGRLDFFLDLEVSPVTFDIATYLVGAELVRRRSGLPSIRLIIVPGRAQDGLRPEAPDYEAAVDRDARSWRVRHIVLAMSELLPTVNSLVLCASRAEAARLCGAAAHIFPAGYATELPIPPSSWGIRTALAQAKDPWPLLVAPEQAKRAVRRYVKTAVANRRLIVITLREYGYNPARNSRLDDWLRFAEELDPQSYAVVFVPDFDRSLEPRPELQRYMTLPQAAWNVSLRLALYEQAHVCLAVGQGPMELAWYSETTRYITFIELNSAPQTTIETLAAFGIQFGVTPAYARPWQRWIWKPDTIENIRTAFSESVAQAEADGWTERNAVRVARPAVP